MKNLREVLERHQLWLNGEEGGECADLRGTDLSFTTLSGANLSGADLSCADLNDANLSGDNLSGANLSGANLSGANLSFTNLNDANLNDANLSGASLIGCAGDRNKIKSIFIASEYPINYTAEVLEIGCECHAIGDWWEFDDDAILAMDGKKALRFWKKYKDLIRQIIELCPAEPTCKEG